MRTQQVCEKKSDHDVATIPTYCNQLAKLLAHLAHPCPSEQVIAPQKPHVVVIVELLTSLQIKRPRGARYASAGRSPFQWMETTTISRAIVHPDMDFLLFI